MAQKLIFFRTWWLRFRHAFSKVPLIGPLFYCDGKDHIAASKEIFFGLSFATATFWLSALFLLSVKTETARSYFELILATVSHGELFIFSVGFLGPILLVTSEDPAEARPFPGRSWHVLALLVLGFIAAGFHSQIKAAQFEQRLSAYDQDFLFSASLIIAGAAIILRYLSVLYRKSTFKPKSELKDVEEEFAKKFEQRHRESIE
jgi:glucan phosphoethanolaminetransferase (alkaline phosphatase superfamily)